MDLLTTATSADERERDAQIAVLPVGSFEQHGDHLPLTTDTIVACTIAKAIAERYNLFLLSPITISCSHEHAAFAGTVSIRASTLYTLINDIADSLKASGVHKLLVVNGHGGNYVLSNVIQELNTHQLSAALYPDSTQWTRARRESGMLTSSHEDMHAGELEVSILLAAAPSSVRDGHAESDHIADDRAMLLTLGMSSYTRSGVIGRASLGNAEKGEHLVERLAETANEAVSLLRGVQQEGTTK